MATAITSEEHPISIPCGTHTLDGFRDWATSGDFPEKGNVSFFAGEIWIDMSPEQVESHNQVKAEITGVLGRLARQLDLGKVYPDGLWITNDEAGLSTEADGTFASWSTLESGRLRLIPKQGQQDGLEMRGTPDWVLEVVSPSSVRKDTKILPERYHQAGIREYWLIDARGDEILFTLFQHQAKGYIVAEPDDGWLTSHVFPRQFRLDRTRDRIGGWQYTLHQREAK